MCHFEEQSEEKFSFIAHKRRFLPSVEMTILLDI
jgi:hypothetical protein